MTTLSTSTTAVSNVSKLNKFILAQNLWRSGKTCMEKLKALLKVMDSTAALLVRSSKRWSMAAAITVGIEDDTDDMMDDEDTIAGSTCTLNNGTKYHGRSRRLYYHWHRSVSDMRNVAKILNTISSRCETNTQCSLCSDFNANPEAVDAIPCLLVAALQTYHRLTVDVSHFLATSQSYVSRNTTCMNLKDLDPQEVTIVTGSTKQNTVAATNQIQSNQVFMHGSCNQPYRYGGRVGLFGHYLRSLRIILLLTCIKLDAVLPNRRKRCSKEHLLKSICELATNLEGVERRYVKKGQRLLFCGPDLMALVPKCTEIRAAFDALHDDKESTADCWFACFQENMNNLVQMLQRFEARQVQILLQMKVSSAFQSSMKRNSKEIPSEHKFFCEDIEPISLNWTKVDEAMSTSVISDDSSFDDLDNLEEAENDFKEDIPTTLIHESR